MTSLNTGNVCNLANLGLMNRTLTSGVHLQVKAQRGDCPAWIVRCFVVVGGGVGVCVGVGVILVVNAAAVVVLVIVVVVVVVVVVVDVDVDVNVVVVMQYVRSCFLNVLC